MLACILSVPMMVSKRQSPSLAFNDIRERQEPLYVRQG